MTDEQIIEMAFQAKPVGGLEFDEAGIVRFFHLVAAHQRELDAKVAEDRAISEDDCPSAVNGWWPDQVLFRCAAAIRGTK